MQHSPTNSPQATDEMEWGVLGPSGRVWVPDSENSAGNPVDREQWRTFAEGTGMDLVQRAPSGDWTAVSA